MTDFTRRQLEAMLAQPHNPPTQSFKLAVRRLASQALSQMKRIEELERRLADEVIENARLRK